MSLDQTGRYVLAANYAGGNVAIFPMLKDGRLGEASAVIEHTAPTVDPSGRRPHQIDLSHDNRFAIVSYLGLDQLLVYRFDPAKGTLANDPPSRNFIMAQGRDTSPSIPTTSSSTYWKKRLPASTDFPTMRQPEPCAEWPQVQLCPRGFKGDNTTAEIEVHPDGKFLYSSNRGHDSIAILAIDQATCMPRFLEAVSTGGKKPRNFEIAPGGSYLVAANQNSNNIVIFRIDRQTGHLTPTGQVLEVPSPACIKFVMIK